MSDAAKPQPNDALYEVQVWNVDTSTAEWSVLVVGQALARVVDQAEDFLASTPDDEQLRVVVTNRG